MTLSRIAATLSSTARRILDPAHDKDQVVEACTRTLRPHTLRLNGRTSRLAARLDHQQIGSLSINRLHYGAAVTVSPAEPDENSFLVSMPVRGRALFRYGSETAVATPDNAVVVGPYDLFQFDLDADYDQVVLRLDRHRVETVAGQAMTTGPGRRVELPLSLGLPPALLCSLIESSMSISTVKDSIWQHRVSLHLEELIIESLLIPSGDVATPFQPRSPGGIASLRVRRATEYMLERIGEPVSLSSVARCCGISIRSLQASFRRELDTTPGQWLKMKRLETAHRILRESDPDGTSVTEVALQCGFFHLGEFSTQFKSRYGTTPSVVLKAARIR
ncbi:AraC family transcriptional regulator [Paenarthrobacter nicotinovorans]|uniref:AraC family transcriptional regulator n=1 Tax=Paenarthrobacter nicotinovorans TaxID=29320 RepID=UPI003DA32443